MPLLHVQTEKQHVSHLFTIKKRTLAIIGAGMELGRKAYTYIAGGVANWCSHSGKQYGGSSLNVDWIHHLTQLPHSLLDLHPEDLKSAYYSNAATSLYNS